MKKVVLLVNFGGPRTLEDIEPFLCELLTDPELIRPKLPLFFHRRLFQRIARKRAPKVRIDYEEMGGGSPIYRDTEALAQLLREHTGCEFLTFHRYLPSTHEQSFQEIERAADSEILVLPLFPQFSYATTGSIATLFAKRLSQRALHSLRWVKSYPTHPAFIDAWSDLIRTHMDKEEESFLFFSAHGIPQSFVDTGDPYEWECRRTVNALLERFPRAQGKLAYQSQFGPEEWLRPYTKDLCEEIVRWTDRRSVLVIPLSFTSDHLETLFEIEQLYLPRIASFGLKATRCPALNLHPAWVEALAVILQEQNLCTNQMLVRSQSV